MTMESNPQQQNILIRWYRFIAERFSLVVHLPLIFFYVSANALVAWGSSGESATVSKALVLSGIVTALIFCHLRIFDEIKDYRTDLAAHPDRPLPRGLLSLDEAKSGAIVLITVELSLSLLIGPAAFLALAATILYSLLMFREFFIGSWLRPRLATYALTHTLIACWMSLFIFAAATGRHFWQVPEAYSWFVLVNWMIFNIFEFGRKSFGKEEEQELVDSYSKRTGSFGAAGNVIVMASVAVFIAFRMEQGFGLGTLFLAAVAALYAVTLLSAFIYAIANNAQWAQLFREVCSLFILLYNVIITAGFVVRGGWLW